MVVNYELQGYWSTQVYEIVVKSAEQGFGCLSGSLTPVNPWTVTVCVSTLISIRVLQYFSGTIECTM